MALYRLRRNEWEKGQKPIHIISNTKNKRVNKADWRETSRKPSKTDLPSSDRGKDDESGPSTNVKRARTGIMHGHLGGPKGLVVSKKVIGKKRWWEKWD